MLQDEFGLRNSFPLSRDIKRIWLVLILQADFLKELGVVVSFLNLFDFGEGPLFEIDIVGEFRFVDQGG